MGACKYLARGAESTAGIVSRIRWTGGTVTADSVTPSSGSGPSQTFALKFGDTSGAANISAAIVWFNATMPTSAANTCLSFYDRAGNTLSLLNDAGTALTSATIGSSGSLQNSQCMITLGTSTTVVTSGPDDPEPRVTFKPALPE